METEVNLIKYNLHWREDHAYGYQIKRDLFNDLIKHLDARPIIGIIGLRRTGKTVLLKQVIDHLIRQKVERDRILYFSFDEENVSIQEVINEFLSRTGQNISGTPQLYIFFDEIQKLEGWQTQLKYYYDTHPRFKFFVSGSSSLFLKKKAEELDCVLVRDNKVVPIESKYRNNIMKKHIKGLLKFMDVYSIDNGLVVTKDLEHEELVDGKHIEYVPLWKWLLGSS